ncbi:MAG: exo-alpha-sialidase, partial [Clostridia bacterium]|nr:exo-alpha-sialidase [Clostridia bacterium]
MENNALIDGSISGFGRDNAKQPCEVLYKPDDPKYSEDIRQFQGCPTLAVTKGGRLFLGWYSGGTKEPHIENYNLLVYSDDNGESFSRPLLVIPSSAERFVHALDIQLWIAPNGSLWVFWVQNNAFPDTSELAESLKGSSGRPSVSKDGWRFPDMRHTSWCVVCDDPDAEDMIFSEPRMIGIGFLRCKPLVLSSGRWIFFNYDQLNDRYGYSISDDEGKSFTRYYGAEKICTNFDETMAYERKDGSLRMLARANSVGEIAESVSFDKGITWENTKLSGIPNPGTRFFVSRAP